MPRFFFIFFIFALSFSTGMVRAQSVQDEYLEEKIEIREFDKERWKSLSEDIDYSGETREEEPEEDQERSSSGGSSGSINQVSGIAEIFKYTIIGAAIFLVIFLLVKLLEREGPRNKKIDPVSEMEIEEIEENLETADLNDPIRRAIASGNFALAIRLYYLSLLKELSLKNIIRWKRDKTNGEYMRELVGSPISEMFRDVTLVYERIWYGTVELNKTDFPAIEKEFKNAIATVEKTKAVN